MTEQKKIPPTHSVPPKVPAVTAHLPQTVIIRLSQLPFAREQRMQEAQAVLPKGLDFTVDLGPWFALPVSIPAPLKPETYGQKSQTPAQSVPGYASAAVAPASQPYQQPYQQPYAQPQGRPGGLSGLSEYELKKRQELEEYERQQKARLYGTTQPQSPQGAPFPSAQYPAVNAHSGHFTAAAPAIDPGELENAKAALTRIQAFEDQFIDSMNDAIRNDYFYLVEEIKTIDAKPQAEQYELMRRYRGFLKEKLYWLKWSTYNDYILLHKFRVAHS